MSIVYNGEKDRAFKDACSELIPGMLENDKDVIYLDADLMSCIGTTKYAKAHPDRAIDCGIAEANMVGIACGLAAAGFKPICHTFGPFASRRVFDQVFMSGAYAKNAITILGSDPGVCAAYNGGTHMPFEDVAMYRAIPESTIIDLTDTTMFTNMLPKLVEMPGVKYIRLPRKNAVKVYGEGSEFEAGKAVVCREGKDIAIFACGIMVAKALAAAEKLAEKGIDAAVIDVVTIKPLDVETVKAYAAKCGCVMTCENHNKIGGLYGAVAECVVNNAPVPVGYVAVEDIFGEVGPQDYLEERFGLTAEHIVEVAEKTIARK